MLLLFIAAGGAVGALARHGLVAWVHGWAGASVPWGTFAVNTIGSFLIGGLMGYVETSPLSPTLRTVLAVGLLGSFTTFSTYAFETVTLVRDGQALRAVLYSFGSLAIGGAAVCAGLFVVLASAGAK
jgi:CrcB protein